MNERNQKQKLRGKEKGQETGAEEKKERRYEFVCASARCVWGVGRRNVGA